MTSEKLKYTVRINYAPTTNNYTASRRGYHKRKWNVKNILSFVGCTLMVIFIAWVFCSWLDIICNNVSTFQYAWWNAFRLFV